MGHKVHPYGFRIGIIKPWLAKWYADRDYATLLQEDMKIRQLVAKQLSNASVSQLEIERGINHVTVTVHSAKPGIVIGKGGSNVEALRTAVGKLTDKKVKLEIKEVLQPELDGVLVAQNVAGQLERRIAFRKAIKQSIQRTIKAGAKGVKVQVSGRLGGSEMSRTEWDKEGRIPLGTLRADISYGLVHARTTYGRIGVKVWIYRGEQLGERPGSARTEPRERTRPGARGGRSRTGLSTNAPAAAASGGTATATLVPPRPRTRPSPASRPRSTAPIEESPAAASATATSEPQIDVTPHAETAAEAAPRAETTPKAQSAAKAEKLPKAESAAKADTSKAESAVKADTAKGENAPAPEKEA